jgi:hypothetical protein
MSEDSMRNWSENVSTEARTDIAAALSTESPHCWLLRVKWTMEINTVDSLKVLSHVHAMSRYLQKGDGGWHTDVRAAPFWEFSGHETLPPEHHHCTIGDLGGFRLVRH